ncbi:TetR/AcrR family transcriptional regulator [Amycolatopsis sp. NBC_00345]|uniref:TetR family transcriptional regulator n=1 Tax=Amycolatopsis sp. NBC_00345 TaxID=2975955 RepID=UPI002E254BDD
MGRWAPDARGRLEQAALELYAERGFDQTTVAEIADRAGLKQRSFFRYFADKRDVLFWSQTALRELCVAAIMDAPEIVSPIDGVALALDHAAVVIEERSELVRKRKIVIAANPELRERELLKLVNLADAVAEALGRRGVDAVLANVAAEAGVTVFRIAYARWADQPGEVDLRQLLVDVMSQLHAVTARGSNRT